MTEQNGQANPILTKQFRVLSQYLLKMSKQDHFVKNPILKVFLDVKVELKQTLEFVLK